MSTAEATRTTAAEAFADEIRERLQGRGGMPASWGIDLGPDGYLRIDATQTPTVVSLDRAPSTVTIEITPAYLRRVLDGDLTMHALMMTGRIRLHDNAMMALVLNMILVGR